MPAESGRRISTRRHRPRAEERVEALAVLPLFVRLDGQRTVVAGGGDGAAWKVELLAAAGARVDVFAPTPGDELVRLAAERPGVHVHPRCWRASDLSGAMLAVCDTEHDEEAAAFVAAARAAGAIANVVDKPMAGCVQFGSIVNRSPLVIGISTAGAAPIFAQRVRQRVEAALPACISDWAALAARLRKSVMRRLGTGAARRWFWRQLADHAFSRVFDAQSAPMVRALLDRAEQGAGRDGGQVVTLEIGSDDVDALTLGQLRLMGSADVVVYDEAVAPTVLELARREAAREVASNTLINQLAEHVAAQRAVVRLVRLERGATNTDQGRFCERVAERAELSIT